MNVFSKLRDALTGKTAPSEEGSEVDRLSEEDRENFAKWRERRL